MKKITLALSILMALGLTACASKNADQANSYTGQILLSSYQGDNLKLTIRKNGCEQQKEAAETVEIVSQYDSTLVVGACVRVSDNGQAIKNVSTITPRSYL